MENIRDSMMGTKRAANFWIIILGAGCLISMALFFTKTGLLWKLKLVEVPLIFFMSSFLIASFAYEETIKELFDHLVIQRFGAFVALVLSVFTLIMKVLQNSF